jgi:hypothetical protein
MHCAGSINFGSGVLWMTNVSVWFAAKSSLAGKSMLPAAHAETGRCG